MLPPFRPNNVRPVAVAKRIRQSMSTRAISISADGTYAAERKGPTPDRIAIRTQSVEIRAKPLLTED